ncbi:PAS domain S-box protein [Aromatoleum toluvorans]|uniref:PAS domain S-box protein n=1 Tax=Aromatoleum toluvorans TaxID=92002 RepID=A0ABX1Q2I1_9RHOO|nr:PAS domain S-box protein [Aromatoleum toluvorans]NMG45127.1 PAS domain S-box protein [Aromatoleum toluvorans]
MSKILVVDDRPTNRQFLVTLLGYAGHRLLEAADGLQGLELARAERPELVISDILMPGMDGCTMVEHMRADPALRGIPVIFYTATYRLGEARTLAQGVGVTRVLSKPSRPQEILDAVAGALGADASAPAAAVATEPEPEETRLEPESAAEQLLNLEGVSLQLAALLELGFDLVAERDPQQLMELFCHAARKLMGTRYAAVAVFGRDAERLRHYVASSVDLPLPAGLAQPPVAPAALLARLMQDRRPVRLAEPAAIAAGLPPGHPPLSAFLGVPLVSTRRRYGWLYFGDKLGAAAFGEADERTALTLAAQAIIGYENAQMYALLERHAAKLQREVGERLRAERKFRGLLEAAPDAMVVADAGGRIIFANSQTEALFGYARGELLGESLEILVPERLRGQHAQHRHHYGSAPTNRPMGALGLELRGRRRDGGEFPVEISLSPLEAEEGLLVTAAIRDVTERERAKTRLEEASQRMQLLSQRVLEAQEVERRRIAHELHDEIGQALTAMKINIEFALQQAESDDQTRRLKECVHIVEHTLSQVRSLSLDLRPPQLEELGLVAALRWHVDRQAKISGITPHFVASPLPRRLHPAIETACFRVAQEALTNVVRHARAQQVWIFLGKRDGELHLSVRDDGGGFDVQTARGLAAKGGSVGLLGMQERVMLVGGRLEISAEPGAGTEIRAAFPLPPRRRRTENRHAEEMR